MSIIVRLIINALALLIVSYLGIGVHVSNLGAALLGAFILGIANALVRPMLFLLTLPLTLLTLGLFTFVVNAIVFWLVAYVTPGFKVDNFGAAFVASLILWAISWVMSHLVATRAERRAL
jgi:putative membrane protein